MADIVVKEAEEERYLKILLEKWRENWPLPLPVEEVYPHGKVPISEYLRRWARDHPERDAVIFYGSRITYNELNELSDRFACFLKELGVRKGDVVALHLPNCPQLLITYFGSLKAGCIAALMNPRAKRYETEYLLGEIEPRVVVCLDRNYPMMSDVARKAGGVEGIVATCLSDFMEKAEIETPPEVKEPKKDIGEGWDLVKVLKEAEADTGKVDVKLDDPATIVFTGGTYKLPKPCLHTHWNVLFKAALTYTYINAAPIVKKYRKQSVKFEVLEKEFEDDVILGAMPSFWIAGKLCCVDGPIFGGKTVVLMEKWDPVSAMQAIERYKVTITYLEFSLYDEILRHPKVGRYNLKSLRSCIGTSITTRLTKSLRMRWFDLTGVVLCEVSYGLAESHTYDTIANAFFIENLDVERSERYNGVFCGIPSPKTFIKIVDPETGKILPPGEVGEIMLKSPAMAKSYFSKPKGAPLPLIDGWMRTGDIGMYDEDGFIYYMGRIEEGKMETPFYPAEVEEVIAKHPAVKIAKVIKHSHPDYGEVVAAFIELEEKYRRKEGVEEELRAWCRANLPLHKVPELFVIKEKIPVTVIGKVNVRALKKELDEIFKEVDKG